MKIHVYLWWFVRISLLSITLSRANSVTDYHIIREITTDVRSPSEESRNEKLQEENEVRVHQSDSVGKKKNSWTSGRDSVRLITWSVSCFVPRNAENYISIIVRIHAGTMPVCMDLRFLFVFLLSFETSGGIEYYRRSFQIENSLTKQIWKRSRIFHTKIDIGTLIVNSNLKLARREKWNL